MRIIVLAIVILLGSRVLQADASDADRYIGPVQTYADNVLNYGRDNLGPKHTPLFFDGINVDTLQPPVWKAKGVEWVLSDLACQQNLMRTLDGLTRLTGEQKYRGAAVRVIRYAFDNLQAPNGLTYWGGHCSYDAGRDVLVWEKDGHELKTHYPYYELMYQVDPKAATRCLEAILKGHIYDWHNLNMNRHARYDRDTPRPPLDTYKGGPVFFLSKEGYLSFINTGSDLYYAGAMLHRLTGDNDALVWAKRIAHRYVETRNPNTGLSGYQYSQREPDRAKAQFGDLERLKGHLVLEGTILDNNASTIYATAGIARMKLGDMLGAEGKEFSRWAVEELTSYGKWAYDPGTNAFSCMLTDGTKISSADIVRDGYYGKPETPGKLRPVKADETFLWAYAMAFRVSQDPFMWQMAGRIARAIGLGDIGTTAADSPRLDSAAKNSNVSALLGCLELYKATHRSEFLDMARRIGDNILERSFNKGFFAQSRDHLCARFDALEPLALLTLAATMQGRPELVPEVWPSNSYPYFAASIYAKKRAAASPR